jgi:hypothetical protein
MTPMMLFLLVLAGSLVILSCHVIIISLLDYYTLLTNKQNFFNDFLAMHLFRKAFYFEKAFLCMSKLCRRSLVGEVGINSREVLTLSYVLLFDILT